MKLQVFSFLTLLLTVPLSLARSSFDQKSAPVIAKQPNSKSENDARRRENIKEAFRRTWEGYREHAWGHDSLRPLSNSYTNDRNGWGASAVDALSTAIIMEEEEIVCDILDLVSQIDFSKTDSIVSVFETTIRYLGGLISAYDLLTGPYRHLSPSPGAVETLIRQAVTLADLLKVAFDTPSGVPDNSLLFDPKPRIESGRLNGLATTGTLILEWTRLSDITGDDQYAKLVRKATSYLLDPKPSINEPFPGIIGDQISIVDGSVVTNKGGWGGGTDSFYEYLIKMYVYDPERFSKNKERWVLAADSTMRYLASHPSTRPDLTFVAGHSGTRPNFASGHLDCFHGGNFILGGLVLNNSTWTDFGLELTKSCHATYASTSTGIGPEGWRWQDGSLPEDKESNPGPPESQAEFYKENGFWIATSNYALRPEVIESFYYAYRATGDTEYQDWIWDAFANINRTCSVGTGISSIKNVNPKEGKSVEYEDFQESFWFAEVLKYIYLAHLDGNVLVHVQKDGRNRFVFNTEAHPIRVC